MENNDLIVEVVYLIIYLALSGAVLYVGRYTAEQGERFAVALVSLIRTITPRLRRLFDPNTAAARFVKARGINPALVDDAVEMLSDALDKWAAQHEAQPLGERDHA